MCQGDGVTDWLALRWWTLSRRSRGRILSVPKVMGGGEIVNIYLVCEFILCLLCVFVHCFGLCEVHGTDINLALI